MIDIVTERTVAPQTHLPMLIQEVLVVLPFICSLIAGLNSTSHPVRSWVHILGFAALLSITILVILDLEYPRVGLIHLDKFDQLLVDLRGSM